MKTQNRWHLIALTTGTLIPLLGVGTAAASLLPGGIGSDWQQWVLNTYRNPVEQILGQWQQSDPIREKIMETAFGLLWEDLKGSIQIDIPDPYKIRTTEGVKGAGVLTHNPIVQQRDLGNLYDQETARAMAAPVLGEAGKTWLEQEAQRISGVVDQSLKQTQAAEALAEEAQSMGVTQDVMKQSAQIDAVVAKLVTQQTQLTADNHTALLQLQQLQGILAQLAADTSEGIDESNRRDRLERQISIAGSAQAPIYLPGLMNTGTTENQK
jgi:hypothetical protein